MSRARFRALYGAGVVNLLVLLLSFLIAGFAVVGWFQRPRDVATVIEWFVAAILLHDLVAVPLYTLLDRVVLGWLGQRDRAAGRRGRRVIAVVGATPYLRVPAILSGLLLAVFFPVIFGLGSQAELSASGIAEKGYLARWLIASGVLFGLSGIAWGVAVARARRGFARPAVARAPAPAPGRGAGTPPAPAPGRDAAEPPAPTPEPTTPTDAPPPAPASPAPTDVAGPPPTADPEPEAPGDDAAPPPLPD